MKAIDFGGPPAKEDRPPHHQEPINVEEFTNTTNSFDTTGSECRCGYGETCACPACPFYANWWFDWQPPQDLLSQLRRRYEAKKRLPPLCHSGVRDPEGMDWWRR